MIDLPFLRVSDDIAPSHTTNFLAQPQDRVDIGLEMPTAVPAKHELVAVDIDMLVADSVEGSCRPSLKVRKDAVNPRQNDMGRTAERRVGNACVSTYSFRWSLYHYEKHTHINCTSNSTNNTN